MLLYACLSKPFFYLGTIVLLTVACCKKADDKVGCTSSDAENYDPTANIGCTGCCVFRKQSGVLFWTANPYLNTNCGVITIKLSNGQQTTISGYYPLGATNCVNQVGGYFLLDVGTYDYEIKSSFGCTLSGGMLTVLEGCNRFNID